MTMIARLHPDSAGLMRLCNLKKFSHKTKEKIN
jgi:hypothetical protein